jgi:hypothetical protein
VEKSPAIPEVREKINQIGALITSLHPLVPKLNDPPTQNELLRALFELTKQVEVIKKHLLKLEKRDESSLL